MANKKLTDNMKLTEHKNPSLVSLVLPAGKYSIEFQKCENGRDYEGAILLREDEKGWMPVADFPVRLVQEHQKMGIQFEFILK